MVKEPSHTNLTYTLNGSQNTEPALQYVTPNCPHPSQQAVPHFGRITVSVPVYLHHLEENSTLYCSMSKLPVPFLKSKGKQCG